MPKRDKQLSPWPNMTSRSIHRSICDRWWYWHGLGRTLRFLLRILATSINKTYYFKTGPTGLASCWSSAKLRGGRTPTTFSKIRSWRVVVNFYSAEFWNKELPRTGERPDDVQIKTKDAMSRRWHLLNLMSSGFWVSLLKLVVKNQLDGQYDKVNYDSINKWLGLGWVAQKVKVLGSYL